MRRLFHYFAWIGLILALAVGNVVFASGSQEDPAQKRTITVAFQNAKGLNYVDENGNYSGIIIDYLNEIAKYTDWNYQYIVGTSEELLQGMTQGEYDLIGGIYFDEVYTQWLDYPDYSVGSNKGVLFARADDDRVKSYDIYSMNGTTIGVFDQAKEKIRRLQYYIDFHKLNCTLQYYSYSDMVNGNLYAYLLNGDVDLLLGNDTENPSGIRIAAQFEAQPIYLAVGKDRTDILEQMNWAMGQIMSCNPEFTQQLYNTNFVEKESPILMLTQEEMEYIYKTKSLRVAAVTDWRPLYSLDNKGNHQGIVPDILGEVEKFTGLQFTYIYVDTYQEALEMVKNGEADILGSYADSDMQATREGLALTSYFATLSNIVVKNKASTYPGSGLTGALLKGRHLPESIEAGDILYFDTIEQGLKAVNKGEADFFFGLSTALEQNLQNFNYNNISVITLNNNSSNICFALKRPAQTELLTILNKCIYHLTDAQKENIIAKNMTAVGYSKISISALVYSNPWGFAALVGCLILVAASVVVALQHAKVRNTLIESELQKAEAGSRAKSHFLSKMSHEIRTPMNAIVGLSELVCMTEQLPFDVKEKLVKIRSSSQYMLALINDILDMSRIENDKMVINVDNFSMEHLVDELKSMFQPQAEQKGVECVFESHLSYDWYRGDAIRLKQVLTNLLSNAMKFTPEGGKIRLLIKGFQDNKDIKKIYFSVEDTGVGILPEYQESIFLPFEQLGSSAAKSTGTGLGLPISKSIVLLMGGNLQLSSVPGKGSQFFFALELPLGEATVSKEVQKKTVQQGLNGVRVLLVEDNDLNAEIAAELLRMQGAISVRAENGQVGVEKFMASAPGEYQVILMDLQMPVKNGLEAAKEIRGLSHPDARRVPIIAMTANSFKEDVEAATQAGMNGFVPKPVDVNYLFQVLKEMVLDK